MSSKSRRWQHSGRHSADVCTSRTKRRLRAAATHDKSSAATADEAESELQQISVADDGRTDRGPSWRLRGSSDEDRITAGGTRSPNVHRSARVMCWYTSNMNHESVTVEKVEQMTGVLVVRPVQANFDVARGEDRLTHSSDTANNVCQFIKEGSRDCLRARPIDRQNDAIERTSRYTDTYGLK
jgi:hypothetical protein